MSISSFLNLLLPLKSLSTVGLDFGVPHFSGSFTIQLSFNGVTGILLLLQLLMLYKYMLIVYYTGISVILSIVVLMAVICCNFGPQKSRH